MNSRSRTSCRPVLALAGAIAMSVLGAGCRMGTATSTLCETQGDCPDTEVCLDGMCRRACLGNDQCLATELCTNGLCVTNDDFVPCLPSAPPRACTSLAVDLWHVAGVGACYLGTQRCLDTGEWETTCDAGVPTPEVADNNIDDDCDGLVDEGSTCAPAGSTRPCFLGVPPEQVAATVKGECVAGVQACEPDTVNGDRWSSTCLGEVRPQRAAIDSSVGGDDVGYGFAELGGADVAASQCDGLDNDCDGLFDEEPWFDADADGYTVCGTTFTPDPLTPSRNTFAVGGTGSQNIDCDDADATVKPGLYFGYDAAGTCSYCLPALLGACDPLVATCVSENTRPTCTVPDSDTCVGATAPSWSDAAASGPADPYDDCQGLDCSAYYAGLTGGLCFVRNDIASEDHLCAAGAVCPSAAAACPTQPAAATPLPVGPCKHIDTGCTGTTPPHEANQGAGSDLFDECNLSIADCNTSSGGTGPYYDGIAGTPAVCYFKATPADNTCNGTGGCRTRPEECLAADQGEPAPRATCTTPTSGCTGTTAPVATAVALGQDPYGDCTTIGYGCCRPAGLGTCCKAPGSACTTGDQCASTFCVEGVCCNTACAGDCDSCTEDLNDVADGQCLPIVLPGSVDYQDISPTALCTLGGVGCGASFTSCQCAPGTSSCRAADGQTCTADIDCASSQCECIDAACSAKKCSAVDCSCRYNTTGNFSCDGNITDGLDDAVNTCGALTCNGSGACHLANGATCTVNTACESNRCECGNATCSTKMCSAVTCGACTYSNGTTCAGLYIADGSDDLANTCTTSTCDGAGGCNRARGAECTADYQCTENHCVDGVCCNSECDTVCRACTMALTGSTTGVCYPINQQITDTVPTALCTNTGVGCQPGTSCQCRPSTAQCLRATGQTCSGDTVCASYQCLGGTCQ